MAMKDKIFYEQSKPNNFLMKWATLTSQSGVINVYLKLLRQFCNNLKLLPVFNQELVNEKLERSAVKVARSVLRGGRQSNLLSLPD